RSEGIDERAGAVREIVVRAAGEGQALRLEDVAEVKDSFADVPLISRLNGVPGVNLTVFRKGDEDVVELAEMAKAYVAGRKGQSFAPGMSDRLMLALRPPGSTDPVSNVHEAYLLGASKAGRSLPGELDITTDLAKFVVGRLDLLTRNAFFGGILVFATLVLLLNWRVSFWVAAGLVISLAGTLVMMRMTGLTLNLLTMFGLIVVLGILVDDAIVVAENITARHEKGEPALVAAVRGTKQVGWPVVATVLTTICAFAPLGMVGGDFGDILSTLPLVVACALLVSLIESLFILPSHMGHSLKHADHAVREHREGLLSRIDHRLDRARTWFFDSLVTPAYTATLKRAINAPYTTTAIALAAVIAVTGLAAGKRVEFIFFETNDAETVQIDLQMPIGTPLSQTDTYARRIEAALDEQPEISNYFTTVGSIGSIDGTAPTSSATHLAQMILELVPVENRDQSSEQVINSIRRDLGDFAGIKSLRMQGVAGGPGGPAISLTVSGERAEELEAVSREIMDALAGFRGVVDISSDSEAGQRELRFRLRDGASELGFTRTSLGQQLQAFSFGIEAFTFAGERENVDVRVMLPERERRSLAALERQFVFTPDGTPVPLAEVAEIEETTGYSTIRRFDRERSINVTADVDRGTGANPEEVAAGVRPAIQEILARYPGVTVLERGRQEDFSDAMSSLPLGFRDGASELGFTRTSLGQQLQAFS
ncbi:MAG: efflux RND transporter permease subunit, partial [Planctomycetota bacterium]